MPTITLPDGSTRSFDRPVSPAEVAADIGPGLAKAAVGAKIDGKLVGLDEVIESNVDLSLITLPRGKGHADDDALWLIRHSAAHVMAEAIQRVYPEAQLVYGPPVDGGFYYDIAMPEGQSISSDDFEQIEAIMAEIIAEDLPFVRHACSAEEGMERLKADASKYKIDNAQRAIDTGAETLTWYATGESDDAWDDLCRGPHVPSTGRIGASKIMSVASSYWHGDANSDRLTRVYGTAFAHRAHLKEHLEQPCSHDNRYRRQHACR